MKLWIKLIFLFIICFCVACGERNGIKGVRLKVNIQPEKLTDELYIKMDYCFDFSKKFRGFNKEYIVFVHFLDLKNKEMLISDNHVPEKRTSKWEKNDKIEYSRVIFLPKLIHKLNNDSDRYKQVELKIGLYFPKVKGHKIILYQKVLKIQPASLFAPAVHYGKGWWKKKTIKGKKGIKLKSWVWTKKKATCIIENPGIESLLILTGNVRKKILKDQKVKFKINGILLDEFIPSTKNFSKKYILTSGMMGQGDEFILTIETDKTIIPALIKPGVKDRRELGIQIYNIYFRQTYGIKIPKE